MKSKKETAYTVVIGGLNTDIAGLAGGDFRLRDSNPGTVRISTGGVGQNIARNLVCLGVPTALISVCGDDAFGRFALEDCRRAGIDVSQVDVLCGAASSTYLYINNAAGDLVTAVNDMKITEALTPERLAPKLPFINAASLVVLDANLPAETLIWLAGHVEVPLAADPVSVAKAERLLPVLSALTILKPNELEVLRLAGMERAGSTAAEPEAGGSAGTTVEEAAAAARRLVERGVRHVFVSMGARGLLYVSAETERLVPTLARPEEIVSTNGAGDCAMAAILKSFLVLTGEDFSKEAAVLSQAASAINMRSAAAFSEELNWDAVVKKRREHYD